MFHGTVFSHSTNDIGPESWKKSHKCMHQQLLLASQKKNRRIVKQNIIVVLEVYV